MRYFIELESTVLNLSSGNIYNMQAYSTKFVGDKLVLSNFMEASGIQTDAQLAFSAQALEKINKNIREQTEIPAAIKSASKYISIGTRPKLLYKASVNGWSPSTFRQLCDNKGPTITVATLVDGRFIGAYSPISWQSSNTGYTNNIEAFLYDSDKKYSSANSEWGIGNYTIYNLASYGPTFGGGHDFLSLPSWNPKSLSNNVFTFLNNGKGPLGANRHTYNSYQLKDFEVYSVKVEAKLMLKVAGKDDIPSNCESGDYKCQAKDICEKVTGLTCVHQEYDCMYGNRGSWRPSDVTGSSDFNFAYGYDAVANNGYGNICACDRSKMSKYGLATNNQYCGLGKWTRQ